MKDFSETLMIDLREEDWCSVLRTYGRWLTTTGSQEFDASFALFEDRSKVIIPNRMLVAEEAPVCLLWF